MADLAAALRFTADLAAVKGVEQFARVALEGLDRLVPADLWGFNDLEPSSREMVAFIWPEDGAAPEHFEAVAKVVWDHPVIGQFQRTGDGSPTRISDIWSADRYHDSTLYRDAYAAMGVEHQVSFSLSDGPFAATIGFAANRHDRDFTDDELDLLRLLRPSLRSAWQRAQASSALATTVELLAAAHPLLLVDARHVATVVSDEACDVLVMAGIHVVEGASVPEPLRGWLRRQGHRRVLRVGDLELRVVAGSGDAERVIAVRRLAPPASGLTVRELEVVSLAASGATDGDIARRLEISTRTVQKHLEHAYAKLGVQNRTAAASALRH